MSGILLSEQQALVRQKARTALRDLGREVVEANDRAAVFRHLEHFQPAVAVIGLVGSGALDSIDLILQLRSQYREIPVVLFTPESSEDLAIAAIKAGVHDYVRQPCYDELVTAVARHIRPQPNSQPRSITLPWQGPPLVGQSPAISRVRDYVLKVASSECNVLITGETGTGKELVAEAIHRNSPRRHKPFVAINCAAIPDSLLESELFGHERGAFTGAVASNSGKFLQADGGCVFLDEIGDMSPILQAKILRAIEAKEVQRLGGKGICKVDIRFIAATNQDLQQLMPDNRFRRDLYFRLGVTQIKLPPLRERPEDIPLLTELFVEALNCQLGRSVQGVSPAVMSRFMRYSWPGSVRELKNVMEALFVTRESGWFSLDDLPDHFTWHRDDAVEMVQEERTRIVSALQTTNWNMSKAARELSWCRMTLYRKIAKYKIVKRAKPRVADPSLQPQARALPPGVEHNPRTDSAQKWRAVGGSER
jgi:DNA-binding NtrC family response regulator